MFLLKILLLLVLSAGAVLSIYDPYTAVKTKSYHRDPHIGRELRRHHHHRPDYHSRLSNERYQQSQPLEQHERHANNGHSGRDYANNIDDYYGGCPSGFTGLLAYPYDCRRFLNCWKGRAYIQTCGPGTVFNSETLECDNPEKVVCHGLSDAPKRNPEPQNHRLGRLHTDQNGNGDASCPSSFTGLLPHPYDCSKFLNCASGVMHVQSCGPQTMFNPIMKVCDFAHKVDCSGRGVGVGNSPSTPSLPTVSANRGGKTFETITRENQAGIQNVPPRKGGPPPHHHHHNHHEHRHDVHGGHTSHVPSTGSIHRDLDCTEAHHHVQTTPIFHRDRWTNMNRTRPSPPGETPSWQTPKTLTTPVRSWTRTTVTNSNWSPTPVPSTTTQSPRPAYDSSSSSWTRTTPISPSSNYPNTNYDNSFNRTRTDSHHTTSTTNIYYAQPVDDDRPSEEVFSNVDGGDISEITLPSRRHNASRGVYFPPSSQDPRPSYPSMDAINIPNTRLMPPHQFSPSDDRQYQVPDQSPDFSSPHPSYTPPRFNPGFGHFNRTTTVYVSPSRENYYPSIDAINIPSDRKSPANYPNPDPEPPQSGSRRWDDGSYPSPHDTSMDTINIPSTNLMPPHRDSPNWPPVSEPDDGQAQLPEYGPFNTTTFFISPPEPASNPEPTWITNDESNLFGGLLPPMPTAPQPPGRESHSPLPPPTKPTPPIGPLYISSTTPTPPGKTNVRTFQIYPPPSIQNATSKIHPYPFYTPSYSGVAHSRNTSWPAVKTAPSALQPRFLGPGDNSEPDIIFNRDDGVVVPNKLHPMMSATTPERRGVSPPNYNREFYKQTTPSSGRRASDHSDTSDEVDQLAVSEAIRLLLRPYFNRSGTVTDDMAAKAESHIMNLARSAEPSSTSTSPPPSAEIHKDVEIVFAGEQNSLTPNPDHPIHTHVHQPFKYNHRHHDRNFHSRNPHMPNPFENELEGKPESRQEATTPRTRIPVSTTTEPSPDLDDIEDLSDVCEFDCGNGQCVAAVETCDGVDNCGNRRDEQNCDHLGYQLRLSGQGTGRLEVKIQGRWGYICDDKFGIQDANVACRELGFPLGASAVHGNSFYPPNEGEAVAFFMDEVECLGNETSLKDCKFMGWGLSDCGSDEVVGVECKTPVMKCPNDYWLCRTSDECIHPSFVCDNVPDCSDKSDESNAVCNSTVEFRLKGGASKMEGRLEVLYHGVWGSVCDDDFGQTEAQVACNSLGYYGQAKIVKNAFGPGSGPIWLDQVSCFGNESSIDKCNHWSWAEHNCNHTEDVSLKCAIGTQPRSLSTAPKSRQQSKFDEQPKTLDDIGMDYYFMERSSKLANTRGKVCGHFNGNLTEDVPRELERVVNGNVAKRGHHPWQATIRTKGHGGMSKHWCGAVLISKKHLLTAAHCLVGYSKGAYFIRLGDHYANIAEASEVDSFIENWYIHEKFREGTHMNNDIAVIVMKNSVRFNDYIQPICLPSKETAYNEGRECTISGWGSIQSGVSTPSNNLRVAQIPIISDDICKLPHVYGNSITEGMFCAGFLEEGVDACEGDSGGPFVCSDSDAETLYGIISWGQHCGHANKPGVYVKVEKYLDWIYEKIRFSMQQPT